MKKNLRLVNKPILSKPIFHTEVVSKILPEVAGEDNNNMNFW